jgi:two-component system, NarL family, invasion response regulator UvrY
MLAAPERALQRSRAISSTPPAPVGVLAVDDDPGFLRLARLVVSNTPGFDYLGEASTGEDALSLVSALRPALVLMDVRLPGMGGIEAARRICEGAVGTTVVVMSSDPTLLTIEDIPAGDVRVFRKERLSPRALRALWHR